MASDDESAAGDQNERIGALYGCALSNFDSLGEFQLALSNAMTYRSYNWDADQLETVLERFVEADVSSNPAWCNEDYRLLYNGEVSDDAE